MNYSGYLTWNSPARYIEATDEWLLSMYVWDIDHASYTYSQEAIFTTDLSQMCSQDFALVTSTFDASSTWGDTVELTNDDGNYAFWVGDWVTLEAGTWDRADMGTYYYK
jgi:hypothetical protein